MGEWHVKNLTPLHKILFNSSSFKEGYTAAMSHSIKLATKEEDIKKFWKNTKEANQYINKNEEFIPSFTNMIRELERIELLQDIRAEHGLKNAAEAMGYLTGLGASLHGKYGIENVAKLGIQLARLHPQISSYLLGVYVLPLIKIPKSIIEGDANEKLKIFTRIKTKTALRSLPDLMERLIDEAKLGTEELRMRRTLAQKGIEYMKQINEELDNENFNEAKKLLKSRIYELEKHNVPIHSFYYELENSIENRDVKRAKSLTNYVIKSLMYTLEHLDKTIKKQEQARHNTEELVKILNTTITKEDFKGHIVEFSQDDVTKLSQWTDLETEHLEKIETVLDNMDAKLHHLVNLSNALRRQDIRNVLKQATERKKTGRVEWFKEMLKSAKNFFLNKIGKNKRGDSREKTVEMMIELLARGDPKTREIISKYHSEGKIDELFKEIKKRYEEIYSR